MKVFPVTPYSDHGESYAISSQSDCDLSIGEAFSSSFSPSSPCPAPWQYLTPLRKASSGSPSTTEMGELAFPQTTLALTSPTDEYYPMSSMTRIMLASIQGQNFSYSTPCKTERDHEMLNFDYSSGNVLFSPVVGHDFLGDMPALSFDGSTSPIEMNSSTGNFVDPSQTYFEPYPPMTPTSINVSRASLGSPLTPYSQPTGNLRYFVGPYSCTPSHLAPSSSSSTSSAALVRKTSPDKVLERSAALHRVQSSSARVHKQQIKLPQFEVDHVAVGAHKCTVPGCKSERGFKRLEHLKRHQKTHYEKKEIKCKYCKNDLSQSDRPDNYRAHVRLHAIPYRKGKRTKFYPEAKAEVAGWDETKAHRARAKSSPAAKAVKPNSRRNTRIPSNDEC
jgi:hypothetical protein